MFSPISLPFLAVLTRFVAVQCQHQKLRQPFCVVLGNFVLLRSELVGVLCVGLRFRRFPSLICTQVPGYAAPERA